MEPKVKKSSFFTRMIANFSSIKYHVLITATIFYANSHLSEQAWKEIVMVLIGIRTVDKGVQVMRSKRNGA